MTGRNLQLWKVHHQSVPEIDFFLSSQAICTRKLGAVLMSARSINLPLFVSYNERVISYCLRESFLRVSRRSHLMFPAIRPTWTSSAWRTWRISEPSRTIAMDDHHHTTCPRLSTLGNDACMPPKRYGTSPEPPPLPNSQVIDSLASVADVRVNVSHARLTEVSGSFADSHVVQ